MPTQIKSTAMAMTTQVLTSLDAIEGIGSQIAHLRVAAEDTTVWLNQSVLALWFKHFSAQTPYFVACFDDQNRMVALAPFVRQRVALGGFNRFITRLQWLGTDPSLNDSARILIDPTTPLEPVMKAVLQAVLRAPWDMLDLRQCADSAEVAFLLSGLEHAGLKVAQSAGQPISWVTLPDTEEAYMATCPKKRLKQDLSRLQRRIKGDYGAHELALQAVSAQSNDWADKNQLFFEAQAAYWQARGIRTEQERFPALGSFYADLQHAVGDDGHPVAVLSQLFHGDFWLSSHLLLTSAQSRMSHLTVYNPDFKYYRPGLLHLEQLMLVSLAEGLPRYDLGRGDNEYKSLWNLDGVETTDLQVIRSPWVRLALRLDDWLKARLKKGPAHGNG